MSSHVKRILIDERMRIEKDIERLNMKLRDNNTDIDGYIKRIERLKNDINCVGNEIKRKQEIIAELDEIILNAN